MVIVFKIFMFMKIITNKYKKKKKNHDKNIKIETYDDTIHHMFQILVRSSGQKLLITFPFRNIQKKNS